MCCMVSLLVILGTLKESAKFHWKLILPFGIFTEFSHHFSVIKAKSFRPLQFIMKHVAQYLSPEYKNALETLVVSLGNGYATLDNLTEHCVYQGNIQFIRNTFASRHIPSADSWRWNQAKSRKTVHIPGGQVTFFKLAPRKTHPNSDSALPSFKIWKYCIKLKNNGIFYCLWCEKGLPQNHSRDWNTVSLQDFQFLAPFMNPDIVSEFWPSIAWQS